MADINTVILANDKGSPASESSDYTAMIDDWQMISDIRAGARIVKEAGQKYLPKYEKESNASYTFRLASAPWRPEFVDALRNLCSKPFSKEVDVGPDAPDIVTGKVIDPKTKRRAGGLIDDIDGQGNSLHVFSRDTFTNGVAAGLEAILVDFPTMAADMTLADERASGARPYWVHVPASSIIALYTRVVNGRTIVDHIRIRECVIERDGFAEVLVERVRVFEIDPETNKPTWQLWTAVVVEGKAGFELTAAGEITLPEIPIALFFTGERSGNYKVTPPLIDLAVMQMELYRDLSRLDEVLTYAGSPMLKGTGMTPPAPTRNADGTETVSQITVGPKTILFAPPAMEGVAPDWDFIQPNAANITALNEHSESLCEDMRRLGLQPMTPKSGNMTATGAAIEGAKSHSAVEVWANGLKDVLEQCMKFTAQWLNLPDTITVSVHTDFGVDVQGTEEMKVIGDMQKRGIVSPKTEREEGVRRGILGPEFDEDEEEQRLAEHEQGQQLAPEKMIDPVTGQPVVVTPQHGVLNPPPQPIVN